MNVQTLDDALVRRRVLAALSDNNKLNRRVAIRRLRNENRSATLRACVGILDSPEEAVRESTAEILPIIGTSDETQADMMRHLRTNPSAAVRRACAAQLRCVHGEAADDAMLAALDDVDADVVITACMSLGNRGGRHAIDALYGLLWHPIWSVRFNACVALVNLRAADARVVDILQLLRSLPEAAEHDDAEQFAEAESRSLADSLPAQARIGRVDEILGRAQTMVSKRRRQISA